MKMRNRNEAPAAILANVEVFDYLKEKVGERKTRTEAYCDLLDKSLAGFVSPFLRRQDYDLSPCQCHVTVSTLHRSGIGIGLLSARFWTRSKRSDS